MYPVLDEGGRKRHLFWCIEVEKNLLCWFIEVGKNPPVLIEGGKEKPVLIDGGKEFLVGNIHLLLVKFSRKISTNDMNTCRCKIF
jgi:hypothetical protein